MRITERYEAALKQTLRRITVGEDDVDHELFITNTAAMDSRGVQGFKPLLTVLLTMPALVPGDRIGNAFQFNTVHPNMEEFDERIQAMLTELRELRLRLVSEIEHNTVTATLSAGGS